jgi:hypothetical protein
MILKISPRALLVFHKENEGSKEFSRAAAAAAARQKLI